VALMANAPSAMVTSTIAVRLSHDGAYAKMRHVAENIGTQSPRRAWPRPSIATA